MQEPIPNAAPNANPGSAPNPMPSPRPNYGYWSCLPHFSSRTERRVIFAIGVALLVCGPGITGYHQASLVGLGLIIFSSLVH